LGKLSKEGFAGGGEALWDCVQGFKSLSGAGNLQVRGESAGTLGEQMKLEDKQKEKVENSNFGMQEEIPTSTPSSSMGGGKN